MIKFVRVCVGVLLACGVATAASAQTKWDMPTPYPDGNFHTKNVIQFAADVDKATNGSLKITVHSAGSLIKHPEIKRSVRQGTAPIGEMLEILSSNEAAGLRARLRAVPRYRVRGIAQALRRAEALSGKAARLRRSDIAVLRAVAAARALRQARDQVGRRAKGLKFRTYNAMIGRIAALAGSIPTQIEVPDLPTAFATGRVDVMITSASTGVDTKAQDYLTHYIDTQAWLPRNIVIVNKEAFDKLSAAEKKAVTDAAKTAEDRGWKLSVEEMTIKTKALKDAGIKVLPPTPELKGRSCQNRRDHRRGVGEICRRRRRGNACGVQEVSAS